MKKRYEEILEAVVRTFLQTHEPIGSASLKARLPFEISPATIRYYFNKMVERGELAQLHKSSGRIPTEETMRRYWRKHLRDLDSISRAMDEVAKIGEQEDLFILLKPVRSNRLVAIERVGSRYLVLAFVREEYAMRYQPQLEAFLRDLIGYELDEVKQIARDVGMMSLYHKMRARQEEEVTVINPESVMRVAVESGAWGRGQARRFLEGDVVEELGLGLHFDPLLPRGYMAMRANAVIDGVPNKMVCMGAIDHDFAKLLNTR
jgi:heat-inducible transcriptional repressor